MSFFDDIYGKLAYGSTAQGSTTVYDQLKSAGLSPEQKPSLDTLKAVRDILVKIVSPDDACLLLAWLGGAHDRADPNFLFVDIGLSAQSACGVAQWKQALGSFAYRSVDEALGDMTARGADLAKCAALIRGAGKAKAKASAKKQASEANADALQLAKDALAAVTPEGLGSSVSVGVGVAVAVVALVIAYKVLK